MSIRIKRLVIFGDSLSDVGNMGERKIGAFALLNPWHRFSDGRNWIDFLWEAASKRTMMLSNDRTETKARSVAHRSLEHADNRGDGMELVNYAEGGATAMAGSAGVHGIRDWVKTGLLSNLESQVKTWLAQLDNFPAARDRVPASETLHIIWAGANDIVTVHRDKELMKDVAMGVVATARKLLEKPSLHGSHVVFINLPNLEDMPKFEKNDEQARTNMHEAVQNFNETLSRLVNPDLGFDYLKYRSTIALIDIAQYMTRQALAAEGFAPFAQTTKNERGKAVGSERVEKASLLENEDAGFDAESTLTTVKDKLHPTEGVYQYIAKCIAKELATLGYDWPERPS